MVNNKSYIAHNLHTGIWQSYHDVNCYKKKLVQDGHAKNERERERERERC